ncbi:hypothetical protein WKW80_25505 [Variovorax humicola]|uniref:Uncharacterized protein n=1 Tax=Variovorax humicola TaxID=1769758 RepID=A0ABU8W5L8_9BURK
MRIDFHLENQIAPTMRRKIVVTFLCMALFGGSTALEQSSKPLLPVMMIHFDEYPKDRARIMALENRLRSAIKHADVGELGETEFHIDGSDGYFYMYGPDPDRMYKVAAPILKSSKLMTGAEVTKYYGSRAETFVIRRDGVR